MNVILSNRLARFSTITFGEQLKTYQAQDAFARHALSQTYGPVVEQWVLRIQQGKQGTSCLISAVDQGLLDGLQQACAENQLRLNLVTPFLPPVFNRFRKIITSNPAWLVINEPGHSLMALLAGGEFVAINGVGHDQIDDLAMLLDRENLISTLAGPCKSVYLFAPCCRNLSALPKNGYELNNLDLVVPDVFSAASDGLQAMILSEFL